jgi:hypothetical protein
MDKLEHYRTCIQTLLEKRSQSKSRNEEIENELFCDTVRDHYQPLHLFPDNQTGKYICC